MSANGSSCDLVKRMTLGVQARQHSFTCRVRVFRTRHTSDPRASVETQAQMAEVILLIAAGSFGTLSAAYAAASPDAFGVKDAQ